MTKKTRPIILSCLNFLACPTLIWWSTSLGNTDVICVLHFARVKLRIHSADGVHADAFSLASYSEGFGCRWRLFSSASLFKLVLKCCLTVQIIMYLFGWTAPLMIWPFNVLFGVLETNFSQSHFQYQTLFNHLASSNLRIIRTQEKTEFLSWWHVPEVCHREWPACCVVLSQLWNTVISVGTFYAALPLPNPR